MRDQLRAAERLGLRARQLTSANSDDWPEVERQLKADQIDLLLVSPERLANDDFRNLVGSSSLSKAGLIVIDEAHCISDWGHDFRPDYQRIGELIRRLPPTTAVLATTATANNRVVEDIGRQIGTEIRILRGPLARESLKLQVITISDQAERLAWLADHLNKLPGSGIIYALTQHDTERVAKWLQRLGYSAQAYHSGLSPEVKIDLENRLLKNELKALVATVALGMGFDKPDVGFVVHYQSPGNLVAYYQQIGRAGRAIKEAIAVLFMGSEDDSIHEWFINSARPSEDSILSVLNALDEEGLSLSSISERLNLPRSEIDKVLKSLSVLSASPIIKLGTRYQRTPMKYVHDAERDAALKRRRDEERQRFISFSSTKDCLLASVQKELDDLDAEACGKCANCVGNDIVSSQIDQKTIREAVTFLKRSEFAILPRKRWQASAFPTNGFSGNIRIEHQCSVGLCLSCWGDPGIAHQVRDDKQGGSFRDDLVIDAVAAIKRFEHYEGADWVCAVPSLRSGSLVPSFARRLAEALGIEYIDAVAKIKETDQQKMQKNSAHQAHNLDGAFKVLRALTGRVILVDDIVRSGWTFTVIGALLLQAGSGPVFPLALSSTGCGGGND
jgi:ATP-dependent DNA helicase RecQ